MRVLLIIFAFAILVKCFAKFETKRQGRIIGGRDAKIIDYPYQVSLAYPIMGHFCGGTIYKANIIITAAHCVHDIQPSEILVRAGSTFREDGGVVMKVKKIISSTLWNEKTIDGDLAILILRENLPLSPEIKPIDLATEETITDQIANISGWGLTNPDNFSEDGEPMLPKKLKAIEIPIFDWNKCNKVLNGKLTKNMFCAGLRSGKKDSCQMDSGGPLVINNKLFGVTSWGKGCGMPNSPGVYAKVKNFVDWIKNVTE